MTKQLHDYGELKIQRTLPPIGCTSSKKHIFSSFRGHVEHKTQRMNDTDTDGNSIETRLQSIQYFLFYLTLALFFFILSFSLSLGDIKWALTERKKRKLRIFCVTFFHAVVFYRRSEFILSQCNGQVKNGNVIQVEMDIRRVFFFVSNSIINIITFCFSRPFLVFSRPFLHFIERNEQKKVFLSVTPTIVSFLNKESLQRCINLGFYLHYLFVYFSFKEFN